MELTRRIIKDEDINDEENLTLLSSTNDNTNTGRRKKSSRNYKPSRFIALALFAIATLSLYNYISHGVSNHKLLDDNIISIISWSMTIVIIISISCCVYLGMLIYKHISCIYTPITLVRSTCRNRPKLIIGCITLLFIIGTFQLECDSYRELHNATDNTVKLCAKNKKTKFGGYSTVIQFIPSWFFVEQSIRRFLGDTFLFDVQHTLPQLDWRTAVLDTDKCRSVLNDFMQDGQNQTDTKQCSNVSRKAVEIGPSDRHDKWKGTHHRNEEILAPFRVSDQLRTPDKLFQDDFLTNQLNDCHIDEVSRITLQSSQSSTKTIIEPIGNDNAGIVFVLSDNFNEQNVYHILHMSSLLQCLYIGLEDYSQLNQSISLLLPLDWNNGVGLVTVEALAATYDANIIRLDDNFGTYSRVIHVHGWISDAKAIIRSASLGFQESPPLVLLYE